MYIKKKICVFFIFLCFQLMVLPSDPIDVIRQTNITVQEIFKKNPVLNRTVETELHRIIDNVTDYEIISTSVTSQFCEQLSPLQCREFNTVFKELLRTSSIKKLGRYRADRFEYTDQTVNNGTALVHSFAFYKEDKVQLDYHMKKIENRWFIVNYVVDDVDAIRNYKKQFTRLFSRYRYHDIIIRLKNKIIELEKENRQ